MTKQTTPAPEQQAILDLIRRLDVALAKDKEKQEREGKRVSKTPAGVPLE